MCCSSPICHGISSRRASKSSKQIAKLCRPTRTGSRTLPASQASSHPPAPQVCPGLLHLSAPAPFYHAKTLLLDFVQTKKESTSTHCNTTIPALLSRTSIRGGIWQVTAVIMGGCPLKIVGLWRAELQLQAHAPWVCGGRIVGPT